MDVSKKWIHKGTGSTHIRMDQQVIPTTQIFANSKSPQDHQHHKPRKLGVAHVNRQTAHSPPTKCKPKRVLQFKTAWTGASWNKIVLDLTQGQRGTNVLFILKMVAASPHLPSGEAALIKIVGAIGHATASRRLPQQRPRRRPQQRPQNTAGKLGVAHANRQMAHFQAMRSNPNQVFQLTRARPGATILQIVLDSTRGQRGANAWSILKMVAAKLYLPSGEAVLVKIVGPIGHATATSSRQSELRHVRMASGPVNSC